MSEAHTEHSLSSHRSEALADGITYDGVRIRIGGLIVVSGATIALQGLIGDGYYGVCNVAMC